VVTDYLDALEARDYPRAYDQFCADLQKQRSLSEFERNQEQQPDISSFEVQSATQTSDGYDVPAQVELVNGQSLNATFGVVLDGPGDLRICSITG
jgi:hypothetical protein